MKRFSDSVERTESTAEVDFRALHTALKRHRRVIAIATLFAFVLVATFVNVVTPRYTAESQVLLENQETFFTRPDRVNLTSEQSVQLDPEAVASQVQLINSRDLARRAIKQLGLVGNPEFDPVAGGLGPLKQVLILLGVSPDPTRESIDSRIVSKFLDRLTVYSPPKTRVISIQFTSRDPDLAARAANTIAQLYLQEQSAAKRATARLSADALAAQITDLRAKLLAADDERERYRSQSGLLVGSNNMTVSGQQLADINTDLSKARTTQADAQARASMIRDLIRNGNVADVADVINNDIVRRVSDQRITAQALLARESRTLLPQHPRIKELTAQLAEYDLALKVAAKQAAVALENEAKIAGQRVANLDAVLGQQKRIAGVANVDEVHLRALERISQSYKDQLDSSSTKYQEALARQSSTATPADARIISSAIRPQEPSFPKKVPFIGFGTLAAFVLAVGFVVASELLSERAVFVRPEAASVVLPRLDDAMRPAATQRSDASPKPAWTSADTSVAADLPSDPVFAPVTQSPVGDASIEKWRAPATGMLRIMLSYMKSFGRSAEASMQTSGTSYAERRETSAKNAPGLTMELAVSAEIEAVLNKIVAAHVPGRGLHIVGMDLGEQSGPDILVDLGRALSSKGRAIIVDLDRSPARLAVLAAADEGDRAAITTLHGLAELLSGESNFADVIQKDRGSRLHYITTGLKEADFHDFDLILDALSETYDFIIMMTPTFPQGEIAKVMAPYADFVILAATHAAGDETIADIERDMIGAGAREVLVAGVKTSSTQQKVA